MTKSVMISLSKCESTLRLNGGVQAKKISMILKISWAELGAGLSRGISWQTATDQTQTTP